MDPPSVNKLVKFFENGGGSSSGASVLRLKGAASSGGNTGGASSGGETGGASVLRLKVGGSSGGDTGGASVLRLKGAASSGGNTGGASSGGASVLRLKVGGSSGGDTGGASVLRLKGAASSGGNTGGASSGGASVLRLKVGGSSGGDTGGASSGGETGDASVLRLKGGASVLGAAAAFRIGGAVRANRFKIGRNRSAFRELQQTTTLLMELEKQKIELEDLKKQVEDDSKKKQADLDDLKKQVVAESVKNTLEKLDFVEIMQKKIFDQAIELDKRIQDIQNKLKDRMTFYTGLYYFLFLKGPVCSAMTDYVVTLCFCLVDAASLFGWTVTELMDIFKTKTTLNEQYETLKTVGAQVRAELLLESQSDIVKIINKGRPADMTRIHTFDTTMQQELGFKSLTWWYVLLALLPFLGFLLIVGFGYFGNSKDCGKKVVKK